MVSITGITFKEGGKVYYFAPGKDEYKEGEGVIVETARGMEYGIVVIPRAEVEEEKLISPLKPILRVANERDKEIHKKNLEQRESASKTVREAIERHGLDMKLIDCEFSFDGAKAVFYYSAPQRVDFRELVKDLSSIFHMRIELRQVGIRDEIKILGGLAPCGRECCCSSCMPDMKKVSIKMAKTQGLSLNPSKISGLCGRLMCCLAYENDYYAEAGKLVPKIGSEIETPDGKGTVVNVNMLKMEVRVKIDDKTKDMAVFKDFKLDDLKFKCACGAAANETEDTDDAADEIPETDGVAEESAENAVSRDEPKGGAPQKNHKGKRNGNRPDGGKHQKKPKPDGAKNSESAKGERKSGQSGDGSRAPAEGRSRKNFNRRFHKKPNGDNKKN